MPPLAQSPTRAAPRNCAALPPRRRGGVDAAERSAARVPPRASLAARGPLAAAGLRHTGLPIRRRRLVARHLALGRRLRGVWCLRRTARHSLRAHLARLPRLLARRCHVFRRRGSRLPPQRRRRPGRRPPSAAAPHSPARDRIGRRSSAGSGRGGGRPPAVRESLASAGWLPATPRPLSWQPLSRLPAASPLDHGPRRPQATAPSRLTSCLRAAG